MHIAINGWFVGQQSTGSGQYIHHLLTHIPHQRDDIQLSVYFPSERYDESWVDRWPKINFVPVDVRRLPSNFRKIWWEQNSFPRAVRNRGADVAWVPYWAAPYWQPVPTVVTVHDVIPLLLPAYRGGLHHRAYTRLVAHTARRCEAVITVSNASARDIIRTLRLPANRVHVVYHGPISDVKSGGDGSAEWLDHLESVRLKYELPQRFFLYLGGFDVRKNVDGVVQGYARYLQRGGDADIALVLAGKLPQGASRFIADPRESVDANRLGSQVRYVGWVEEVDKAALYALATAFVFPSHYEGFGMMAIEAMAAGTPVITSAR